MSRTRVVVTGIGATTPLGGTAPETWAALLEGRSGVRRIPDSFPDDLATKIAAPVAVDPSQVLERVEARRLDRCAQLGVVAAMEAWADAGYGLKDDNPVDRQRLAVAIGTGIGGLHTLLGQWDIQKEKGARRVSPLAIPMLMANATAANVGLRLGAQAPVSTAVSACASSNESIAQGLDLIRLGRADVVLVGGAEACIHPMPMASFAQMQAMSRRNDEPERASRPWDVDRDGFVLGEGAGVMVIESEEHAKARGARVYAELAGAGVSSDSHHITAPEPEGLGATRAMRAALRSADITPEDVCHVNAHATSTPKGDAPEYLAMRAVFGDHLDQVQVSATKSQTGHLLGASGAIESILSVLAVHHGQAPVTINLDHQDPEIPLNVVTGSPARLPEGPRVAVKNSFGFGGHNAVAVFRSV